MKTFSWAEFGSTQTRELYAKLERAIAERSAEASKSVEAFTRSVFERTCYDDALAAYLESMTNDRELLVGRYFYRHDKNHNCYYYHYVHSVVHHFKHEMRLLTVYKRDAFESQVHWPDGPRPWSEPAHYSVYAHNRHSLIHPVGDLGTHEITKAEFDVVLNEATSCIDKLRGRI